MGGVRREERDAEAELRRWKVERKSIAWFFENGCELQAPNPLMLMLTHIYIMTLGYPCDGCHCKPTCPAWKVMNRPEARRDPHAGREKCPKCHSPLNMKKVERRGGKCACGAVVGTEAGA